MKHLKTIALAALATAALAVFAGPASGDDLTSPKGTVYTGEFKLAAEGHVVLDNPIAKIECASSIAGKAEKHAAGERVSGINSAFSLTSCTNSWHFTTVAPGELSIEGSNGGVFSTGATVESTRFFGSVTCRYKTNVTQLGTLTDSDTTKGTATLHIAAQIPFHSGSELCGTGVTTWTGSYIVNTPDSLYFDNN